MKCPHCNIDLPSQECRECHARVPMEGKFCHLCGAEMPVPESAAESGEGGIDFSDRVLCSDGTCIGVINERGVCTECGKPYTGESE